VRQLFGPNFWGKGVKLIFAGSLPVGAPNFEPKNCLTNIFLHCVFQFLCSAVQHFYFGRDRFGVHHLEDPKFDPKNCLTNVFLRCKATFTDLRKTSQWNFVANFFFAGPLTELRKYMRKLHFLLCCRG